MIYCTNRDFPLCIHIHLNPFIGRSASNSGRNHSRLDRWFWNCCVSLQPALLVLNSMTNHVEAEGDWSKDTHWYGIYGLAYCTYRYTVHVIMDSSINVHLVLSIPIIIVYIYIYVYVFICVRHLCIVDHSYKSWTRFLSASLPWQLPEGRLVFQVQKCAHDKRCVYWSWMFLDNTCTALWFQWFVLLNL